MSTPPDIRAETLNLNGTLKVRLIASCGGKVVDIDELNVGSARARTAYVDRIAEQLDCDAEEIQTHILKTCTEAMDAATAKATANSTGARESLTAPCYVDDDVIAELAWNCEENRTDFIVYNREAREITRERSLTTTSGVIAVPTFYQGIVTPGGSIQGAVYVPDGCGALDDCENALRQDVAAFIDRYVQLPGDAVLIAVEFVFLSWVFDVFDEVPYLAPKQAYHERHLRVGAGRWARARIGPSAVSDGYVALGFFFRHTQIHDWSAAYADRDFHTPAS